MLRKKLGSIFLAGVMIVTAVSLCIRPSAASAANSRRDYADEVVVLVNEQRANAGLKPLQAVPVLNDAAEVRATEIIEQYSHTRPDGRLCFSILDDNNIGYRTAAENCVYGRSSPEAAVNSWMNSEGHRANILSETSTYIGVGVVEQDDVLYWVQMFTGGVELPDAYIPEKTTTQPTDPPATVTGTCGENLTWEFDESTGTLTISGTGKMNDYDDEDAPWKSLAVTEAVIEDGVTSIGNSAFYECLSLSSVTMPSSLTSIGNYGFAACDSLPSVTIPDGVTSIGFEAFEYCGSLTSVTIPDSVTSIGSYAFAYTPWFSAIVDENGYCVVNHILISVSTLVEGEYVIPDGVTSIGESAFLWCQNMTSVIIPASVTSIGNGSFDGCYKLISVTIENPDCEIFDSPYTITNDYVNDECTFTGTIYGYTNSTAQAHAEKYNYTFKSLDERPTPEYSIGDVDGDGVISTSDAAAILVEIASIGAGTKPSFTDAQNTAANLNGGDLDTGDAALILQYIAVVGAGEDITIDDYIKS